MVAGEHKINLLGLPREELRDFFVDRGEKAFRATQVLKWVHQLGIDDIDVMSNISKVLRSELKRVAEVRVPEIVHAEVSADGTHKWVLKLDSGNNVETVFIPEQGRGTLCVSSQVGCALACGFCATAQQGFNRNLTVAEIIGQVWIANRALGRDPKAARMITNVVMMGMGEPLLNFENVVKAMNLMMDDFAYGLSKRRVTLSTSGVIPAILRLKKVSNVNLAVSLHAPNDELRDQLVPLNKKYPIKELMATCKNYIEDEPRRKVTIEYVMLKDVNDQQQHAQQLIKVLDGIPSKVNLIPFNPFPNAKYQRSNQATIDCFRDILNGAGIFAIIRKTRGEDIDAACGQLVGKVSDRTKRQQRSSTLLAGVG